MVGWLQGLEGVLEEDLKGLCLQNSHCRSPLLFRGHIPREKVEVMPNTTTIDAASPGRPVAMKGDPPLGRPRVVT